MFYSKFKKNGKDYFASYPAIFLLYSFVLKEKDAAKIIRNKSRLVNIVFLNLQMADKPAGHQQKGCPNLRKIVSGIAYYKYKGLFLRLETALSITTKCHSSSFWTKETFTANITALPPVSRDFLLGCKCKKKRRNEYMVAIFEPFS